MSDTAGRERGGGAEHRPSSSSSGGASATGVSTNRCYCRHALPFNRFQTNSGSSSSICHHRRQQLPSHSRESPRSPQTRFPSASFWMQPPPLPASACNHRPWPGNRLLGCHFGDQTFAKLSRQLGLAQHPQAAAPLRRASQARPALKKHHYESWQTGKAWALRDGPAAGSSAHSAQWQQLLKTHSLDPNVVPASQALWGKKCMSSSPARTLPKQAQGLKSSKIFMRPSILCCGAGDVCSAWPLRPPGHPTARHKQVTRHQLKLLFRDLADWEEGAEVWFKPQ